MHRNAHILLTTALLIMMFMSCSSESDNAVSDLVTEQDIHVKSQRELLGIWRLDIDMESQSTKTVFDRDLAAHFDVTELIPPPTVSNESYDGTTQIYQLDLTISNSHDVAGYDVRLIVFVDSDGLLLKNHDNWTALYDMPVGSYINPFIAYAKAEPARQFAGGTSHTETIKIYLPRGILHSDIVFAVDASAPSNCEEPYLIDNFTQDTIGSDVGSSGKITIDVHDWQADVSEVSLQCPAITGNLSEAFIFESGNTWTHDLVNNVGVPSGYYFALISAKSSLSGSLRLYQTVKISIQPNLVAHWPFDEGSGSFVEDLSGNNYDGTQSDPNNWGTSGEAFLGNSCFEQESGRNCVNFPADPLNNFYKGSIEFYVMFYDHGQTGFENSILTYANGISDDDLSIFEYDGHIDVVLRDSNVSLTTGPGSIELDQWYYVILEFTGSQYILYLDEIPVDSASQNQPLGVCNFIRTCNGNYGNVCNNQRPLIGRLDELKIYTVD